VVGAANDKDAIVILEPVYLIQEVTANVWGDNRIQIFENKVARGELSGLVEDFLKRFLGSHPLC
jgi:hypothetical protein